MSAIDSVPDSTDWLSTPLSGLAPLESALRCQICKDFFNTPMITSCSHTFCSLCIRRYLSQEGRCPTCRSGDQELKLRRNWTVEELVGSFVGSRDVLLAFARDSATRLSKPEDESPRPRKRRKVVDGGARIVPTTRSTRSQSSKVVHRSRLERMEDDFVADSEASSEYEDQEKGVSESKTRERDDGLVSCPGCNKRMKAEIVFAHLDTCESGGGGGNGGSTTPTHTNGITTTTAAKSRSLSIPQSQPPSSTISTIKPRDRLPTLAYDMLNDSLLRKKLKELGISNHGPKLLLQKRHTEWVNLWNADCDARHPRSKRELLHELDVWERTQGRQILANAAAGGLTGVMAKDFDGEGWIRGNKGEFDALVRKAREKKKQNRADGAPAAASPVGVPNGGESLSSASAAAAAAAAAASVMDQSQPNATGGDSDGGDAEDRAGGGYGATNNSGEAGGGGAKGAQPHRLDPAVQVGLI